MTLLVSEKDFYLVKNVDSETSVCYLSDFQILWPQLSCHLHF